MINYHPLGGIQQPRFGSGNPFALGAPGFGGMPGFGGLRKKRIPNLGMARPNLGMPLGAPMRPQFPRQVPMGIRPQQFMRNPFMGQMRPY